jgi:hypothetical protein
MLLMERSGRKKWEKGRIGCVLFEHVLTSMGNVVFIFAQTSACEEGRMKSSVQMQPRSVRVRGYI